MKLHEGSGAQPNDLPPLQVTVDRPDVQGRIRILKVHSRGKAIGKVGICRQP